MQSNYQKLNQKVFDAVLEAAGKPLIQDEINEIINRLIKPAFFEGAEISNNFIDYDELSNLFDVYDGECKWRSLK
jgi:hypothetical protein